jgi:hypothetical protein
MMRASRNRILRPLLGLALAISLPIASAATGTAAFAAGSAPTKPAPTTTAPPTTATQPGKPVTNSWALSPTGTDLAQPGTRPTFSYALQPGATVEDSATISNYSNVPLTFHLYATDALNTPSGDFTLLTGGQKSTDVGSWVKLAQDYITVPPATSVQMPFTLTIPADARPGDHSAGLVATSQTTGTDKGAEVLLDRRAGSRIYLRVNGPIHPALTVENLSSTYHAALNPLDGSLDVRYTVRNTGNVRLAAHQTIAVNDVFGTATERKPKDIPELLPGNAITRTQHFTGIAATVRVSTDVALTPYAGTGPTASAGTTPPAAIRASRTSTTVHTWAIPWTLLAVLLLLALVVAYLRYRRRRRLVRSGPGASDGGGPRALPAPPSGPRTPVAVRSVWVRIRGVNAGP